MSIRCINGEEFTLVALARPAGPPYHDQDGSLVGIDYQDYTGGGMSNIRFTREQAEALREALNLHLRYGQTVEVLRARDGTLRTVIDVNPSGQAGIGWAL